MKIKLRVEGCDDETVVEIDATPEELEFLEYLQNRVNSTSTYGCMPRLFLEEIDGDKREN